jgi:Protein of unknown function (DUF4232)
VSTLRRAGVGIAVAMIATALALAGCGSGGGGGGGGAKPASQATTQTVTTTVSHASSTSSTSPTSTSATSTVQAHATGAGCSPHQLAISIKSGGAGLSHVAVVLLFHNTSSDDCTLGGYPGADLVTAAGHDVPAKRTRSGYLGGVAGNGTIPAVRIAPGATASAMLEGLDVNPGNGGAACPQDPRLLVTPPNQTVTVRLVGVQLAMCEPEVHPVVSGTTGSTQ